MSTAARQLPFSPDEYAGRCEAVRRRMRECGVDVLLLDQFEHIVYVAGYLPTAAMYQACVLPLEGEPVMVVRGLDEPTFLEQSWVRDYAAFRDDEDPIAVVQRVLVQRGWDGLYIGVETDSHFLTVQRHEQLRAGLPKATLVDFSGVLWELRVRKSPREITYLRDAAHIADAAILSAIDAVGEGRSERDAAVAAYAAALTLGADNGRVALIAAGKRSNSLHGSLGNHRLTTGDIVHLELVPQVHGYSARVMRSAVIGEPSEELRMTAQRLVAIQDEQIAAMCPGVLASEVDRICRRQVLESGLRDVYTNATGYTLGYHATPRTSDLTRAFLPNAEWVLEEGMVFHMYTWARGMAFSETVLVTDHQPERLTRLERRLFVR